MAILHAYLLYLHYVFVLFSFIISITNEKGAAQAACLIMIKDIWNTLHLFCGGHEEPIEMKLEANKGLFFYRCPDKNCKNEISVHDTEKFIDMISEKMESGITTRNVKGFSCKIRGHKCFVKEHNRDYIKAIIEPITRF